MVIIKFLENKYTKWYYQIINNAQNRKIKGYVEKHHIEPRSLGGSDYPNNLVPLTAREHFVCHWLLAKMVEGQFKHKMLYALSMMKAENKKQKRYHTKITSRVYESLKQNMPPMSFESKRKMIKTKTGVDIKKVGMSLSSERKECMVQKGKEKFLLR